MEHDYLDRLRSTRENTRRRNGKSTILKSTMIQSALSHQWPKMWLQCQMKVNCPTF